MFNSPGSRVGPQLVPRRTNERYSTHIPGAARLQTLALDEEGHEFHLHRQGAETFKGDLVLRLPEDRSASQRHRRRSRLHLHQPSNQESEELRHRLRYRNICLKSRDAWHRHMVKFGQAQKYV